MHTELSDTRLVTQLELWAVEYLRLNNQIETVSQYLSRASTANDNKKVARQEAEIVRARERQLAIENNLTRMGARIFDKTQMEILLQLDPTEDYFFSWQLGEPTIGYCRHTSKQKSNRVPIMKLDELRKEIVYH